MTTDRTAQYHLRTTPAMLARVDKFAADSGMKREEVARLVWALGMRQLDVLDTYTDPAVPAAVARSRHVRALERLVAA